MINNMTFNFRGPGPPWKSLLFILFIFTLGGVASENTNYHMQSLCKNHFLQQLYRKIDGAVLHSQNERNLDCVITFQTHSILQRFMLRFDSLHLDCNDHLYIYDGAHAVGNFKSDLSCRNTKQAVGSIFTRTNFVTLRYVTDGWGTDANGFNLVITAVKDPKHSCMDFRCNLREFCIAKDLVCDGINHCADGSDEAISSTCSMPNRDKIFGMETILFVAIAVSSTLILCVCVVIMFVCSCRRQAAPQTPSHQLPAYNANMPLQQVHGSNGTGATTIVSKLPGNWRHPAGLLLGYSEARARLYCQAK
uniref:CUB domain-containing protein n=1 Tax=Clastoptera arizonana TaxID=38151 RepID=A0A1B6DDM6_9HEMI